MIVLVIAAMWAQAVSGSSAEGPKGSIQGTVVNEVTGAPVKKARVHLYRRDGPGQQENALTDASGGFSFSGLPAGKYRLRADHPEYSGSAAERAGHYGVEVILQPGDDKTGVAIALTPMAAISGKVVNGEGDPVSYCVVEAMRYQWQGGKKALIAERNVQTNDKGEYRIYNLEAGHYYLRFSSNQEIPQPHALMPDKDVAGLPQLGYATVFYPGAAEASGAARVNVAAGAELRGIDMKLPREKAFSVRGTVEGPAQAFQGGERVQLLLTGAVEGSGTQTDAAPDGSFNFDMMKPGAYVIEAWYRAAYWGRQEITVKDAPIEGVTVRLQPAMEVTGNVEIEVADGSVAKPQGQVKVQLNRAAVAGRFYGMQPEPATVADDGTFSISGLIPGTYEVNVQGQPEPSYVKSLRLGDRDVQETEIPITAGAAGPLRILLGTKMGKIDGTVEGASGAVSVVFFTASSGAFAGVTSADAQGHFHWENAAPGEYRAFALEGENSNVLWENRDLQTALEGRSGKVSVEEGGTATMSLTMISRETLERVMQDND